MERRRERCATAGGTTGVRSTPSLASTTATSPKNREGVEGWSTKGEGVARVDEPHLCPLSLALRERRGLLRCSHGVARDFQAVAGAQQPGEEQRERHETDQERQK